MALVFYEVTDPFALDFGLEVTQVQYVEGQNLRSYNFDDPLFFNAEGTELLDSYIPEDESLIFIVTDIGILGITAAGLAKFIIQMIIAVVISFTMSLVFAPKELDLSDERPTYATYLWGQGATKSEAMLAVPIVLGKFPVYGNLISTISKSQTIDQSVHTLYDNIHLLYGLSSNELSNIDEIYLNDIEAKEYEDSDLAIFYTKGTIDQAPLYALEPLDLEEDGVHRYHWDSETLSNTPLTQGEKLFPNFAVEFYPGYTIEQASHQLDDAVMTYDKVGEYGNVVTLLGVCADSTGTGTLRDLLVSDTAGTYIRVSYVEENTTEHTFNCSDLTLSDPLFLQYCGAYVDGFGKDEQTYELVTTTTTEPFPSGDYVISLQSVDRLTYDPLYITTWDEDIPSIYWTEYLDLLEVERVTVIDNEAVLLINSRTSINHDIAIGKTGQVAEIVEGSATLGAGQWIQTQTSPASPVIYPTSSSFGVEDIIFTISAPQGFFWRRVRRSNPVEYGQAWVSFEYEIKQKLSGSTTKGIKVSPITSTGEIRPPDRNDINTGNLKYFIGKHLTSVVFDINISDVVDYPNTYSGLVNNDQSSFILDSLTLLEVDSNGMLPAKDASGTNYTYEVKLRQYSHGKIHPGNNGTVYYQDPDYSDEAHQAELTVGLKVHRIAEVNYNESVSYPGTALLGLSLNATEALNNSLPSIKVLAENKVYVYDSTNGTHLTTDITTWDFEFSDNPAFICLSLFHDTFYGSGFGGTTLNTSKAANFLMLVDVNKFIEFADYCDELITILGFDDPVKRHVCNGVIDDFLSTWKCIDNILKASDATPALLGSKLSLVWQEDFGEDPVPSTVFSDSNILAGSLTESFQNSESYIDKVTGSFYNEDEGYEQIAINLNLYDIDTDKDANKAKNVDLFGVTNVNRAFRKLRGAIREANIGKHIFSFQTMLEGLNVQIGDLIGIQYEMTDWLNESTSDLPTITGRISSILTSSVIIDKKLPLNNTDTWDNISKILIKTSNTNIFGIYSITAYNSTTLELDLTPIDGVQPALATFSSEDLFIIGTSAPLYVNAVVLETISLSNNITEIKTCQYFSELFDLGSYLLTDFGNLKYTEANCKPNNLVAEVNNFNIIVSWSPPLISKNLKLSGDGSVITSQKLEVLKYLIYRKDSDYTNDPLRQTATTFNQIAEVPGNILSYMDTPVLGDLNFDYQVVPVFKRNNKAVSIPRSWCDIVAIHVDLFADFLPQPEVPSFTSLASEITGYYDLKVVVTHGADWTRGVDEELYAVWRNSYSNTISSSEAEEWLGPQTITLTASCERFDPYIDVSSITGLPTKSGSVFGLITIGDTEVVFISHNVSNRLYIANSTSSYNTAFTIGSAHTSGEAIKSRHHGFFPVKYFATLIDNNLTKGVDRYTSTASSMYRYNQPTNTISEILPTDSGIKEEVGLVTEAASNLSDKEGWRVQTSSDRVVTFLKGIKIATNSAETSDFFVFEHMHLPNEYSDLTFATGFLDNKNNVVRLYSLYRGINKFNIPPATIDTEGNLKAHIQKIATTDEVFWIGIQHSILEWAEDVHGWTSFIKVI